MSISFDDAVDEILSGKKKPITEASLTEKLKMLTSKKKDEIDIKSILEAEDKDGNEEDDEDPDSTIGDRMKKKEDDKDLKVKSKDVKEKEEKKQKEDAKFKEEMESDPVLKSEFNECLYNIIKDPDGVEVFRTYLRLNSENVNIARFGKTEIYQFGGLDAILDKYGLSVGDITGSESVDKTINSAATPTPEAAPESEKKPIDSFKMILKRISKEKSGLQIICAGAKNTKTETESATVSSLGIVTNFDTAQQALEYVDLQYSSIILKDIGSGGED